MRLRIGVVALAVTWLPGGGAPPATLPAVSVASPIVGSSPRRQVRATGTVQAVRVSTVVVPQITGQNGRLTLTALIPNGSRVKATDVLAEFDRIQQLDAGRDAEAKFQDLSHQVEQRSSENRAAAEKRASDLTRAEADLAKAQLQLTRGPLLAEIDRLKNEAKAEDAQARVESLGKSNRFHDVAEAASLRILELQRDRQKLLLERAQRNAEKLVLRAPLAGMVALQTIWRSGSMGHAQEGDQVFPGMPLVRIFDPSEMAVETYVGEPDGALLSPGCRARVVLDAYPDLEFTARLETASPVASAPLDRPVKAFAARFRLDQRDPHLLPDLSAAVILEVAP